MRNLLIVAAWLALTGAAQPPVPKVSDFGWLSGAWIARDQATWTEEYWTPPRGGIMIGAGISGSGDKAGWFEHMRIVAGDDGAVAFFAMPGGAAASRFPLVTSGKGEAVFENGAHDYPQRVHYRRDGETLVATISLLDGSRSQSWTFKRP